MESSTNCTNSTNAPKAGAPSGLSGKIREDIECSFASQFAVEAADFRGQGEEANRYLPPSHFGQYFRTDGLNSRIAYLLPFPSAELRYAAHKTPAPENRRIGFLVLESPKYPGAGCLDEGTA